MTAMLTFMHLISGFGKSRGEFNDASDVECSLCWCQVLHVDITNKDQNVS